MYFNYLWSINTSPPKKLISNSAFFFKNHLTINIRSVTTDTYPPNTLLCNISGVWVVIMVHPASGPPCLVVHAAWWSTLPVVTCCCWVKWRPAVHVDQQARSYSCWLPPVEIDQVEIDQADDQLVEIVVIALLSRCLSRRPISSMLAGTSAWIIYFTIQTRKSAVMFWHQLHPGWSAAD